MLSQAICLILPDAACVTKTGRVQIFYGFLCVNLMARTGNYITIDIFAFKGTYTHKNICYGKDSFCFYKVTYVCLTKVSDKALAKRYFRIFAYFSSG